LIDFQIRKNKHTSASWQKYNSRRISASRQTQTVTCIARRVYSSSVLTALARASADASCRSLVVTRFVTSRSEEHTSDLQSLMRISYAVFFLKKKKNKRN